MGARATSEPSAFERRFLAALEALPIAGSSTRRVLVAYSGGLDSTLLLHWLDRARVSARLVAVHVDHGLHADSARWAAHCEATARALGIDYLGRAVSVLPRPGESLEALAREARYAVLTELVEPGDVLMTAHHADDQLETILLRLLRGTGVRGLTGIHAHAAFGRGRIARPLLGFTRAEIEAEAARLDLRWLEDPSNADPRFDRNYLRAEVLPAMRARWPAAGLVATRLALKMSEAEAILDDVAARDIESVDDPGRIPAALLMGLSPARRRNALRHAVRRNDLPVPSAAQLAELERMLGARDDAEAVVAWPGAEARLYRGHLYLLARAADARTQRARGRGAASADTARGSGRGLERARGRVDARRPWSGNEGKLRLETTAGYGIPERWVEQGLTVAFRAGGERFLPEGGRHHKTLKAWFQEAGIVPWMRGRVPLLYHGDRLVAIADLCLAGDLPRSARDGPFWRPVWTGHARIR